MEFQLAKDGRRIYTREFRAQVVGEAEAGVSAAELGRRYGIPTLSIFKWKAKHRKSQMRELDADAPLAERRDFVPLSEYRKLQDDIKNLKRSLVNMTLDRDILKEAVDIATKKKWI